MLTFQTYPSLILKTAISPKIPTNSISSSRYPRARAMSSRFGALKKTTTKGVIFFGGRTPHGDWGGKKSPHIFLLRWQIFWSYGHELPSYFMDCWTDYPVTNGWADPMGWRGFKHFFLCIFFSRDSAIETYFISTFLVSHVLKPSTSLLLQGSFNGEFFRPGLAHIKI